MFCNVCGGTGEHEVYGESNRREGVVGAGLYGIYGILFQVVQRDTFSRDRIPVKLYLKGQH